MKNPPSIVKTVSIIRAFLGLRYRSSEGEHRKIKHETASSLQTPPSTTTYPSDSHVPSQMEINQQNLRDPVTLIHPLATKMRHIFATLFNGRFLPTLALGYRCFCLKIPKTLLLETWTPNGGVWFLKTRRFPNQVGSRIWLIGMSDWDGWKWFSYLWKLTCNRYNMVVARRSFPFKIVLF